MNKYKPHIFVLPEDKANHDLAQGFELHPSVKRRVIQTLKAAGGWEFVLKIFQDEHVAEMNLYPKSFMILLIDFDNQVENRLQLFQDKIPDHLKGRVFVIGSKSEPEQLRSSLGSYERIGLALAEDCFTNRYET